MRGIVHSAHKGPRVRWSKTTQAGDRQRFDPRSRPPVHFLPLNKSEKEKCLKPLVLLSRERRNFDIERKLTTFERKVLFIFLRSYGNVVSFERRKSAFIFT